MATKLDRPVVRETSERDHRTGKPLIIKLEAGGKLVKLKVKGERSWYTVTIKQILVMGAQNLVAEQRRLKAEAKAAKKKAKE